MSTIASYKSPVIYHMVMTFFMSLSEDSGDFSKIRYRERIAETISCAFGDVELDEVNCDYLVRVLTDNNSGKKIEIKYFTRFLHHMIANGLRFERYEVFEAYYGVLSTNRSRTDNVVRVLSDANFNDYYNNKLYRSNDGVTLSFMTIDKSSFSDEKTYVCISRYFEEVKHNGNLAILTRIALCHGIRSWLTKYFSQLSIKDLSRDVMCSLMIDATNRGYKDGLKVLLRFSIFLAEIRYFDDGRFAILLRFTDYFLASGSDNREIIKIFSDQNPSKYCLYQIDYPKGIRSFLIYINIESDEIRNIVNEFLYIHKHAISVIWTICKEFNETLKGKALTLTSEFNYATFMCQIDYARQYLKSKDGVAFFVGLYHYLYQKYNPKIFCQQSIDPIILQRQGLTHELCEGYDIILYNQSEDMPNSDKFIIQYTGIADSNTSQTITKSFAINFDDVPNFEYREWLKHYIWKASPALYTKINTVKQAKKMFNYIHGVKTGAVLSIFSKKSDDFSITDRDAIAYRSYINEEYDNQKSRYQFIKSARLVLDHVRENGMCNIGDAVFYHLTVSAENFNSNKNPIHKEDLSKLAIEINRKAETDDFYFTLSAIFYLILETEMRYSNIRNLKMDSCHQAAKNQYVIYSMNKTSSGEPVPIAITIYTKEHLDNVIEATSALRAAAPQSHIKELIFIRKGHKVGTISKITEQAFNGFLKKCCILAGIPEYTYSDLRDTHMTKAEEYIIRNNQPVINRLVLDGHASPNTAPRHYVELDFREMLESVNGIIIGDVDITGKVVRHISEDLASDKYKVSNECGYCGSKTCENYSYLDCLLCEYFIATIDRIPFFEEQINAIDKKIENALIIHDREDLVNKKRLLVNYLSRLLCLKEGEIDYEREC